MQIKYTHTHTICKHSFIFLLEIYWLNVPPTISDKSVSYLTTIYYFIEILRIMGSSQRRQFYKGQRLTIAAIDPELCFRFFLLILMLSVKYFELWTFYLF